MSVPSLSMVKQRSVKVHNCGMDARAWFNSPVEAEQDEARMLLVGQCIFCIRAGYPTVVSHFQFCRFPAAGGRGCFSLVLLGESLRVLQIDVERGA